MISECGSFAACKVIEGNDLFLAAIADGKVLFDDPYSIEDCAQHKAVGLLLHSMYEDYFKDENKQITADLLNQHILYHCKAEYPAVAMLPVLMPSMNGRAICLARLRPQRSIQCLPPIANGE